MERGQWVRLFARSPLGTARRILLSGPGGRRAGVPEPQPAAAPSGGGDSGWNSTQAGFLPLPLAFIEGRQQALELGLDKDEHGASGVQTAVADGTLDAYLYGQNAVGSGSSECKRPGHLLWVCWQWLVLPLLSSGERPMSSERDTQQPLILS